MRMKRPQGYKSVKGECSCHGEVHKFRVVFRTLHRMKIEVVPGRERDRINPNYIDPDRDDYPNE